MAPDNDFDLGSPFTPARRLIYRYFDGVMVRAADPLRLQSVLISVEGLDLETDLALIDSSEPAAARDSLARVVAAVRQTFRVPELANAGDGVTTIGLTDAECLELLDHFGRWMGVVKKNWNPSPTSPNSTGSASSADPSPTLSGSASG